MSLGEKLCNARLARKETASEVAKATRMKVQTVEDLEREDFSRLTAAIYAKGFIKLYAEHVGLDPKPLIEEYLARFAQRAAGGAQGVSAHVGKILRAPKPTVDEGEGADATPADDEPPTAPDLFDAQPAASASRHGHARPAAASADGLREVGRQATAAWSGATAWIGRAWGALRLGLSTLGGGVGRQNRPAGAGLSGPQRGLVAGAAVLVLLAVTAAVASRCSKKPVTADEHAPADEAERQAPAELRLATEPAEPYFD